MRPSKRKAAAGRREQVDHGGEAPAALEEVGEEGEELREQRPLVQHPLQRGPGLKGSVGEAPNQTNYSDQSSVRILAKFRNFR